MDPAFLIIANMYLCSVLFQQKRQGATLIAGVSFLILYALGFI